MSLVQDGTGSVTGTFEMRPIPTVVVLLLFALPTIVHLGRALVLRARTVERWLTRRGFDPTAANVAEVRRFLRRFRWTRAAASGAFCVVAALLITQLGVPFGFITGPYLLGLLAVEATAPAPRRGRTRSASLIPRGRDYFAPYRSLWLARSVMSASALAGFSAALGPAGRLAAVHAAVMVLGLLVLEVALAVGARRALPQALEALALDTAMRVQAARTTVAAAVVFGGIGFWYSTLLIAASDPTRSPILLTLTAQLLAYVAVGVALSLAAPLSSWQPRRPA